MILHLTRHGKTEQERLRQDKMRQFWWTTEHCFENIQETIDMYQLKKNYDYDADKIIEHMSIGFIQIIVVFIMMT